MIKNDIVGNYTAIKIITNDNMYYTFMRFPWNELETDENCKHFESVRNYAEWLARNKIQDITFDTNNTLLYLHPEGRAVNRNNIKDIYIDEYIIVEPQG